MKVTQIITITVLAINIALALMKKNWHSALGWILALILYSSTIE